MAKAYTDIEQSKKLAEILPLDSADMVLLHEEPYETSDSKFDGLHQYLCIAYSKYDKGPKTKYRNISYFPAWSLAALLGVIAFPVLSQREDKQWEAWSFPKSSLGEVSIQDDPVDACVDLIISLNSNK